MLSHTNSKSGLDVRSSTSSGKNSDTPPGRPDCAPRDREDPDVDSRVSAKDSQEYASWTACAETMKGHDESMVQGWKEDVDTLLVFAGLFSAVLTAFTIESYQQLQDNPVQTTAELLRYIVVELSNRTLPAPTVDHRNIPAESFQPSPASVRVNTLWFSALVCSLVAALIGILAKQWLREYLIKVSSSPQETVRLRQYRNDGLRRWHVVTIMAMLPVLLELALVLFLLGLLDFLWQLNTTVAAVITFLVGVSFLFYTVTTVLPAFFASSPFKSPQAWGFCKLLWSFRRLRRFVRPLTPIDVMFGDADMYHSLPDNWRERDIGFVRRMAGMLDHRALAWIYKSSLNEDLLDMMVPYISNLQPDEAASLAFEEIARKGECTVTVLIDSIRDNQPRIGFPKFIRRAGERGKRRLANMLLHILPRMDHNARHSGITAFDILFVLRTLLIESERAICEMSIHRRTLDTLTLLLDGRATHHAERSTLCLLSEMTNMGCNLSYCPEGIHNVIICARKAHARNDGETFVRCCSVLIARLPALQRCIQDPQWIGQDLAQGLLCDMSQYFQICNQGQLTYDVGVRIKWCSGLAALAFWRKELIQSNLVVALQTGVHLGLVHFDMEEGDALSRLMDVYCNF